MSRKVKYRGAADRVRMVVLDNFAHGRSFTSRDVHLMMLNLPQRVVSNSLSYLATQYMLEPDQRLQLEKVGYGTYQVLGPDGKPPGNSHHTDERRLLDDLLTAMAAAEPVLRKCAKLMDAVNAMKENS